MTAITTLRLAAALTHAVPGAECTLRCAHDTIVIVGRRHDADMSPCQFRAAVISMNTSPTSPPRPCTESARIFGVEVGGALEEIGAGIVRSRTMCGLEQRWIATTLPWSQLHEALDAASPTGLPDDALVANGRVDHVLGVSLVAITAGERGHETDLDRVATDVATSCLIGELIDPAGSAIVPSDVRADVGTLGDGERP